MVVFIRTPNQLPVGAVTVFTGYLVYVAHAKECRIISCTTLEYSNKITIDIGSVVKRSIFLLGGIEIDFLEL